MESFIENLNGRGETFLTFVWPMLWQSSLLIAVLLAFDFLVRRKVRASVRYMLWLVVLVKLCLPPTLALPTSPAWWMHKTPPPVAAKPVMHYTVTYDDTTPMPEVPAEPMPVYVPPKPSLTTAAWLLSASIAVSALLLCWLLARWWHVTRLVRRAVVSERLTALADEAQRIAGMRLPVRVKLTTNAMSPAVCGLFRPAILIPQPLAENFSDEQMRAVLLHELIHLRRRDVWMNFVQALLQIVYWWHPLVWLANARIRRVREEAVDDAVMLALHDGAEAYAPTLLEVAKLALNRPLVSLGLVGIMESRNALRQRIERLLDFHPPRQAGLTLVSLLGVLAFTAVAVPMGQGPVPAPVDAAGAASATAEEQSLTVRVDRDIFIRNVQAQAARMLLSSTNDYTFIFTEALRGEGLDCNPPHGLAFNNETGEITMQNTPEKLEVFRQVVEQLNRADGKSELPLRSPAIRRKMVIAESRVYQIRAADFEKFTTGLRAYATDGKGDVWWSLEPGKVDQLTVSVEAAGLQPILRPRIQTASGTTAQFFVGDSINGTELDCVPYVKDGFIDFTLLGQAISGGLTEAALTNRFTVKASAQDHGGIVVRMENLGGHAESNLVVVLGLHILTNSPTQFQERLRTIIKRGDSPAPTSGTMNTNVPQIMITGYFTEALISDIQEFEKSLKFNTDATGQHLWATLPPEQFGTVHDQLAALVFHRVSTPRVVTLNGAEAQIHMGDGTNSTDFDCTPVITNGQVNLTFDFRVVRPQAGVLVTNQFHTVETLESKGGLLVKPADAKGTGQSNVMVLARVEIITNAAARFQPRLQKIIKRAPGDAATGSYTPAHQKIVTQLQTIRLAGFMPFKEESLENVVQRLSKAIREQDTNSEGISFLITGPETNQVSRIDPATGLPVTPATLPFDARMALVRLHTPMENPTVMDILDQVVMTTVPPIKYSIADFGVVFSARTQDEIAGLFTRTYKVDKNVFYNGLKQMGGAGAATNSSATISAMARNFFTNLGVNLDSPAGKAVFYNEGNSTLFVKATLADQDFIDHAIQTLNQVPPQVHIKVRFLEMPRGQRADVYLGKMKQIQKVAATPPGVFPRNGIPSSSATLLSVPGNSLPAAGGTNVSQISGILTDSDFRTILKTLNSREGVEYLGEPEVVTLSGRQCQMRVTQVVTVITNFVLQENPTNDATTVSPQMTAVETGPVFGVVPYVMSDGYTINLAVNPCFIEFLGYIQTNATKASYTRSGQRVDLPVVLPNFRVQQTTATANVSDGQTLVIGGMSLKNKIKDKVPVLGSVPLMGKLFQSENTTTNEILVFVTATIVDAVGNRVHADEESSHFQIKAAPDSLNRAF